MIGSGGYVLKLIVLHNITQSDQYFNICCILNTILTYLNVHVISFALLIVPKVINHAYSLFGT